MNACFWYMLVSSDKDWYPPKDSGRETEYYDEDDLSYKYSVSLYYATLLLIGADVTPYDLE